MPNSTLRSETSGNARIVVVDDDDPIREMLVRWLRSAGHRCRSAACADEAVTLLRSEAADLLITDQRMPGRTGLDLLGQVRSEHGETAVILLTGCDDPQLATEAITRGACGYLHKPVQLRDLLFQVSRSLEQRRTFREALDRSSTLEASLAEQARVIRRAHEEIVHRLVVASMVRDDETGAHIKRIGLFSAAVAAAAGWPAEAVENLRLAAPMHDIGKIGIPDAILLKPGRLTPEEFEIMKSHTLIGASILKNSHSPMMQLAERIARSHHEWWNGNGYPDGLRGIDIPTAARITAIVDVYDALTHDRIYRPALPERDALDVLEQGRGEHFDPDLLNVFFAVLPEIRVLSLQAEDELHHDAVTTVDLFHDLLESTSADTRSVAAELRRRSSGSVANVASVEMANGRCFNPELN